MSTRSQHIQKSAERFVPHEFLKAIGKKDLVEAQLGDHSAQEVTILFTDIRDYTTLSESMSPEDNFLLMNAYHRRMGPLITQHDGFVHQFLGDGLMCIFPGRPDDALEASIAMQQYLQDYNKERISKGRETLRVGMGMHTGLLIMGITGDGQRLDAAAIADSVNIASRMEGLTKLYGTPVLLSAESHEKLNHPEDFRFRYLGEVQLKGKKHPIGVYECLDALTPEHRDKKLETLEQFDQALQCYLNKDSSAASALFQSVLDHHPDDTAAHRFLTRAEGHKLHGVPADWNGVEVVEVK